MLKRKTAQLSHREKETMPSTSFRFFTQSQKTECSVLERVGGIAPIVSSKLREPGLRSTATGNRPRPFDSQVKPKISPQTSMFSEQNIVERVGGIEPPTKPWEGLVLPLNHTRRRLGVYGLMALLASLILSVTPVFADNATVTTHFDDSLVANGWTLRLPNGANATVFPGVLPNAADVTWSVSFDATPTLPVKTGQLGSLYRLTVTGASSLITTKYKIAIAVPDVTSYWGHALWYYDISTKNWTQLSTKLNATTGKLQAGVISLDGYVTILEDHAVEIGNASWYCRTSCSKKYPKLHATSNDFPVGSKVVVTNPTNGKSVTVTVVSKWGQPAGRIIDLSGAAYDALKPTNKGVTLVHVSLPSAIVVTTPKTTPATTPAETIASLTPVKTGSTDIPSVAGTEYYVMDQGTGTVLASKNSAAATSIASLTKLMTAMVVLDTNPDLTKTVTYSKADVTSYAYLRVNVGDKLTVKDLLFSMIVGSANNAATALVRSTGMTRPQFVAAMNAKATVLGMTSTHFVDVNGLDPNNVSSAADVAIMAGHAFHDYPTLRKAAVATSYVFTTINTKVKHTLLTTDKNLLKSGSLVITGGKTGFLNEAQYTYAMRVKNTQGAQVIVVILGSPTTTQRFADAVKLANWSWNTYSWK